MISLLVSALAAMPVAGPVGLPPTWAGDIGAPIAPDVYLYGDTIQPGNFVQGTTVLVDGEPLTNVIPATDAGTYYWPGDGTQLPDGSLFLVLEEVRQTGDCTWCFKTIDHDAFHVTGDPAERASWTWATKIEDGWWDFGTAQFDAFIDHSPFAVMSTEWGADAIFQIDAAGEMTGEPISAVFPESSGPFVPVEHDGSWWGTSWAIWGTMAADTVVALWRADRKEGPYEWVRTIDNVGETYGHNLAVIDGVVYHYFSTLNGRVTYQEVSL